MTNELLIRLYSAFFNSPKLEGELASNCSAPLLLNVPPQWEMSKIRVLVIGKEGRGWGIEHNGHYKWHGPTILSYKEFFESEKGIETLRSLYRLFNFGDGQDDTKRSQFWWAFRRLNSSPEVEALWSNVFRCSVKEGSPVRKCSKSELEKVLESQQGLLEQEIKVLKPNAVVFFSGPNYDFAIRKEFEGVTFKPIDENRAGKFDQVLHESLPKICFRTYHPTYLHTHGMWQWVSDLVQLVRSAP